MQLTLARRLLDRVARRGRAACEAPLRRAGRAAARRRASGSPSAEQRARGGRAGAAPPRRPARRDRPPAGGRVQVELGKLDGDLALAAERLANASTTSAAPARRTSVGRWSSGRSTRRRAGARPPRDREARRPASTSASARSWPVGPPRRRRCAAASASSAQGRASGSRRCSSSAQTLRSLEGERAALEGELASLRERAAGAAAHRATLQVELAGAERRRGPRRRAGRLPEPRANGAAAAAEHARHLVAEAREREAMHRADRRRAEEDAGPADRAPQRAGGAGARPRRPCARGRGACSPRGSASTAASSGPLSDFVTTEPRGRGAGRAAAGRLDARRAGARPRRGARGSGLARGPAAGRRWCCSRSIPDPQAAERRPLGGRPAPRRGAWLRGWVRVAARGSEVLETVGPRPSPCERSDLPRRCRRARRARCGAGPSWQPSRRRWTRAGPRCRRRSGAAGDDRAHWPSAERALAATRRRRRSPPARPSARPWPRGTTRPDRRPT